MKPSDGPPTWPAWVNRNLFPFESHFAEVDGARVHYIDEGEGPVFLGLHGNPTWSFLYRHIVNGLNKTVILRGASHYIQEDAPEEIIGAIKEWWPGE